MKTTIMIALALLAGGISTDVEAAGKTDVQKTDVEITIKSGEFSLATPTINNFEDVTLKDNKTLYRTSFDSTPFKVKDLTGNHIGWKVGVSATPFTSSGPGGHTLPTGSIMLDSTNSIKRVSNDAGNGSSPVNSITKGRAIDQGEVEVIKAEKGGGMGVWDFTFPENALSVNIDSTTAKATDSGQKYVSTLTWNLTQAP